MARQTTAAGVKARAPKLKLLTFRYVAHAGQGRQTKGTVRAISEVAAQNLLVERGLTPVSLEPIASQLSLEGALPSLFGIKPRQIITFSRQLATLLESGVSLLPAIQLLESQAAGGAAFNRVLRTMAQDLGTGKSYAQAIARHHAAFSEIYVRTVSVGERTGKLENVLRQMADYMEKQNAFAKKMSGAMTYPAITFVVGILVSGILVTVALPPLSKLFESMNVQLPLPTRVLLGLSAFLNAYMAYVAAAVVAMGIFMAWALRTRRGRHARDRFRLNAPLIGSATRLAELARICRTMSVLLLAGLPLQEIMELLPQVTSNSVLREALERVKRGLFLGQGLAHPMAALPVFPPLMLQMVRVGEESNALENNLTALANFYEATADEKTTALLTMITPLSTIIVAAMAAFIALSVVMPMYQITSAVK